MPRFRSFYASVAIQIVVIVLVWAVERKRVAVLEEDAVRLASRRVGAVEAPRPEEVLEGVPEVAYAAHGVAGMVFSGGAGLRSLDVLLRHHRRWRHCPHRKVVGLFRFSAAANVALFFWYATIANGALRMMLDALRGIESKSVDEALIRGKPGRTVPSRDDRKRE